MNENGKLHNFPYGSIKYFDSDNGLMDNKTHHNRNHLHL